MKTFLRQKHVYIAFVAVFAVILLLGLAQLGSSVNPVPRNLPVILVQQDAGEKLPTGQEMNFGKLLQDKITAAPTQEGAVSPLQWTVAVSEQEAVDAMNRQQAYGAVVIPADFSRKLLSLTTPQGQPAAAVLHTNPGMNNTAATMVNQILNQMLAGMNGQVREQLLGQIAKQGGTLTAEQTKAFAAPIQLTTTTVNPVGTSSMNGNAPVALTQLAWFGAMVATLLLFMAAGKAAAQAGSVTHLLRVRLAQLLGGAVLSAFAAGSIVLVAGTWLGLAIPDYSETWLFLWFTGFAFFLLQTAIVSWLGLKGVPLFVLVFFFGAPVLALPPEMLPSFSHDWLYTWMPLRFGAAGLRDVLYFGQGLNLNAPMWTLGWIGAAGLVLTVMSAAKRQSKPTASAAA
ncbi:YhgE/Pip domain-containing protein [Paenibacillus whitsoniae]|uniref:DUF3533 domain-containing protein n=1 Tax=Paenibacillus whitsoniae TaxID=2496558 RepID=A0A430JEM8_9BACL|nr:DUF3533 domain-containing protein [Paenibacillus whitsoniae]RTE09466.1 DUF3533 domain-containing protein [Paenibacillus whitsoniae]